MGKEAVARHAGVDDGDGLTCPARELPDSLQIEACKLSCISHVGLGGGHGGTTLLLLGGLWWRWWTRLGQHRIVDRWWRNRGHRKRAEQRKSGETASDAKPYHLRDEGRHGRLKPRISP
jgi:hypothetical protein